MRIKITVAILLSCVSWGGAQTTIDRAFDRTVKTLGSLSLGTSLEEFKSQKPNLPPPDTLMQFRSELVETIEKDGLESVTYYFDMDGEKPLYELILRFSNIENRKGVTKKLFGAANHPEKPDYWILGVDGGVISMGWAFDNSFAIAVNLPGTEWDNDQTFQLPKGFEPYKNLPIPTEWPREEIVRFFSDLQLQIDAGIKGFETIKGPPVENHFQCNQPIGMASVSAIQSDGDQHWLVNNAMTTNMTPENTAAWNASMKQILENAEMDRFLLVNAEPKKLFGAKADVWDVFDKQHQPTGIQVALVAFGEKLQGVYVVVMRK